MTRFIILSANESGAVRGPSDLDRDHPVPFAALEPVPLRDGSFALGDEVLSDPAHFRHFAFLSARPTVDLTEILRRLPDRESPVTVSLGALLLNAVKSFFAPDPVG